MEETKYQRRDTEENTGLEAQEKGRRVLGWRGDLQHSEICAAGGRGPPVCSPLALTLPHPIPPEPSFPLSPPLWKSVGDRAFFFSTEDL